MRTNNFQISLRAILLCLQLVPMIIDTIKTVADSVNETVKDVEDAVKGTVVGVNDSVKNTVGAVKGTVVSKFLTKLSQP